MARNAPSISYLMFVDDTMLFCRANKREINTSEDVIDKYEGWSGQQINKHKSGLIFSRILIREQRELFKESWG